MTFFGVDFSLTGTGVASFDGETWDAATIKTTAPDKTAGAFIDRVDKIAASIVSWCDPRDGDTLCMEGPALHAKSSQLDRMFGGWWLVYKALREHGVEPWVIPPTVVKQLATGTGNAGKDEVLIATVRRLDVEIANNNEADAAWLAVAADHITGGGHFPLPIAHLSGLTRLLNNRSKETP